MIIISQGPLITPSKAYKLLLSAKHVRSSVKTNEDTHMLKTAYVLILQVMRVKWFHA